MAGVILIGAGAGLASALLFASIISGSPLAFVLVYLAPLPLLIATLGWGLVAGLGAGLLGAVTLGAAATLRAGVFFAIGVAGPAIWLAHLASLGRPAGESRDLAVREQGGTEWYPIGRIVLWAAALGAASIMLTVMSLGTSLDTVLGGLRLVLAPLFPADRLQEAGVSAEERSVLIASIAFLLPPIAAALWTATTLLNVWLAAKVVARSGRSPRPWPDLAALRFPPLTLLVYAATLGLGLAVPGLFGYVATILAATLTLAFSLLGLAVMHVLTRGRSWRRVLLVAAYISLLVFGWPVFLYALLGLIEQVTNLRARLAPIRPPSPPVSSI